MEMYIQFGFFFDEKENLIAKHTPLFVSSQQRGNRFEFHPSCSFLLTDSVKASVQG
jgi:hypothetical protein